MPSKKFLQERVAYLEGHAAGMDDLTENLNLEIESNKYLIDKLTAERDSWRTKYELLYHTPEVKADIEEAYQRGSSDTMAKFRAWFLTTAQNVGKIIQDSNEE